MRSYRLFPRTALLAILSAFPAASSLSQDAAWKRDLGLWRAQHAAELQAPDGWLSLTGLEWLKPGDNSFGAAPDNAVRIPAAKAPHLGILRVEGDTVQLLPPLGGFPRDFLVDGAPAQVQAIRTSAQKPPSKLSAGSLTLLVLLRGDRYALRVKDSQSPARLGFLGLHWYPPNAAYRVKARWIPYTRHKTLSIATLIGTTVTYPSSGAAEFTLGGKSFRLEPVLEEPESTQLFFIVRDTTSASATYGAGRFLYTGFPDHGLAQPGEMELDFNRLENPPCAYTPYATYPLPPPQNRLPIAIPAGERRYHD